MVKFSTLLKNRLGPDGKPKYWKPIDLDHTPILNNESTVKRVIGNSEELEIDVRHYISQTWKLIGGNVNMIKHNTNNSKVSNTLAKLVLSNIADESVHAHQLRKLRKTYDIDSDSTLSDMWENLDEDPINKAAAIEVGVFMGASLPIMLRCGGLNVSWVSARIAEDERRHVSTNLGLINTYKDPFDISDKLLSLVKDTVAYLTEGFNLPPGHPQGLDESINTDWFINQSRELMTTGKSGKLSSWSNFYRYTPPFEMTNKKAY